MVTWAKIANQNRQNHAQVRSSSCPKPQTRLQCFASRSRPIQLFEGIALFFPVILSPKRHCGIHKLGTSLFYFQVFQDFQTNFSRHFLGFLLFFQELQDTETLQQTKFNRNFHNLMSIFSEQFRGSIKKLDVHSKHVEMFVLFSLYFTGTKVNKKRHLLQV